MTKLGDANAIYYRAGVGGGAATRVYAGPTQAWPVILPLHVERIQARPAGGGTSATSGNFTHGAGFTATMNGTITHIATYHYATHASASVIHPLSLWTNAGVKVAHIDWPCPGTTLLADLERPTPSAGDPEPRATSWYEVPLAVPYAITSGSTYRVSCGATTYTYFSTAPPLTLAPHLVAVTTGFYSAGSDVFPTTAQPANYYPIDVVAEFRYADAGLDSYATAILGTAGLVGYWRLGESSGTVAVDEKLAHVGTYIGGPTLGSPGAIAGNTAATFDGTGPRVEVAGTLRGPTATPTDIEDRSLALGNGPWSIELWVKRARFGGVEMLLSKTTQFELHTEAANVIALGNSSTSTIRSTGTVSDTAWHHVVVTRLDGVAGNTHFYIDGVAGTGATSWNTFSTNAAALTFANRPGGPGPGYAGSLDEVAIYNVVLTPAQVLAHYNAR